jgi:hypothetical protein
LMIDGSGSRGCRICGRFRPVRMVVKRGAIAAIEAKAGREGNCQFAQARVGHSRFASRQPEVVYRRFVRSKK